MVEARASITVFKICYKSSLIYIEIRSEVVGTIARCGPEGLVGWSDSLLLNSESDEK